jgi:hypothetical protein
MKQANATGEEKATNSVLTVTGSVVLDCNHPFKHLKLLSSTVPGYFIVRCVKCDLQNVYSFDETYCLTTKRKNELAKNIGIVQTELDKARLVSERCFEILKEAWHNNDKNEHRYTIPKYKL